MLLADGTAKLLDFGLAKNGDQLSPSGELRLVAQPSPGPGSLSPSCARQTARPPSRARLPRSAVVQRSESLSGMPRPAGELGVAQTSPKPPGRAPTHPQLNSLLTSRDRCSGRLHTWLPRRGNGGGKGRSRIMYSFGALLYELCAGHPPHNFDQLEDISRAARETDVGRFRRWFRR